MRKIHALAIIFGSIFIYPAAYAGESGYLYKGEQHVVFKDGQKVGKTIAEIELNSKKAPGNRRVASINPETGVQETIFYQVDEKNNVVCYLVYLNDRMPAKLLSCVHR